MAWILDLDGVVWLADRSIAGAADAVDRLRASGQRVLFVTNNSSVELAEQEAKLARHGMPASGDLVTSAQAAATLISPGEVVLVCGGAGLVEAVEARGATPVRDGDADVVIVGFTRDFDYGLLRAAAGAVRDGARLLASNDDATYPTPDGPIPGGGAILAAVETGSGRKAVVAGKPYQPMADLVLARIGSGDVAHTMVGDRPDTDGRFARVLGARWALVLSGVATSAETADPSPDVVAVDLAALVAADLDRGPVAPSAVADRSRSGTS
jgi:4-nitrophenyl phosphatase